MPRRCHAALTLLLAGAAVAQVEEVVTRHPSGGVHERYTVDDAGRKQGDYERLRPDGSVAAQASYRDDLLDGRYREFDADGTERLRADYRRGTLDGPLQQWRPDGSHELIEHYRDGELDGRRETYWPHGGRREFTHWRRGVRDGRFEQVGADGDWQRSGSYEEGRLDGTVKITADRKVVSRQVWEHGELRRLGRLQPFPVPRAELLDRLRRILAAPEPAPTHADDPRWAERLAALRRLQAYRALCGLEYAELTLNPEWNASCDAAATVCRANGGLSHDPPRPPGMDEELYRRGHLGASRSNLHRGQPDMVTSVDGYMDDSDPSNIGRVGHRRWCLNPALGRVGFGEDGGYNAMWSMDGSGRPPRGLEEVRYPPAGWTPVDLFGPRHAWSLALLRGSAPDATELTIAVRRLDEYWVPDGEPLELDHCGVADTGQGTGACLIFRPVGLRVEPGARYLVEITEDGDRAPRWRYVVAFCEAVHAATGAADR